jgi:hypothetical protein
MTNQVIKNSLNELAAEAIMEITALKKPLIQLCAPISTGGFGNSKDNLENLNSFIKYFENTEISIFNQLKYERRMDKILRNHTDYDYPLLDYFYSPIFSSGKISGLVFLPMWETSIGCKWEYNFAKTLHIPILITENYTEAEIKIFYKTLLRNQANPPTNN